MTVVNEPVVDHSLNVKVEVSSYFLAQLVEDDVHEGPAPLTQGVFTQVTAQQLSVIYYHLHRGIVFRYYLVIE